MNESHGDIRETSGIDHWKHFEKAWQALITYTYLGKTTEGLDLGVSETQMPLRHDMRNAAGGITAFPLCVLAPEADWADDECVPAPVIMTYEILDPGHDVKRLTVLRDRASVGRTMGFSHSRIVDYDNHNRVIALSSGMSVTLGDVPPGFYKVDNPVNDAADTPDLPPLSKVFRVIEQGENRHVIEKVIPELATPHSALHQGPINVALETAGVAALERAAGPGPYQVWSYSVMMIKPGYQGPFVASAKVINPAGPVFGVEMSLIDEGANGRLMATANATFRKA
jgi:Uncharacterized protein, possibly involved in aromatic compounds catabolism